MFKCLFFTLLIVVLIATIIFGPRLLKDISKKKSRKNCFAIQNVNTGLCIRPFNADFKDETKVIQYGLHNWECITWELINATNGSVLFKNLYTEKTFEPRKNPSEGTHIWQMPFSHSNNQFWIIENAGDANRIRLLGTNLYLTAISNEQNAEIELRNITNDTNQLWKFIPQCPIV